MLPTICRTHIFPSNLQQLENSASFCLLNNFHEGKSAKKKAMLNYSVAGVLQVFLLMNCH